MEAAEFCACGAEWFGRTVYRASAVIAAHRARPRGNAYGCALITHAAYCSRFRCLCADCTRARRRAWHLARPKRRKGGPR